MQAVIPEDEAPAKTSLRKELTQMEPHPSGVDAASKPDDVADESPATHDVDSISLPELAPTRLRARDGDRDGILYVGDFVAVANLTDKTSMRRRSGPHAAFLLGLHANWSRVLFALEELYSFVGRLTADSFPLLPELFRCLDHDRDGFLDAQEAMAQSTLNHASHQ